MDLVVSIYHRHENEPMEQSLQDAVNGYFSHNGLQPLKTVVSLSHEKGGRPVIQNAGNIQISISHSGNLWGCAVSSYPVGFDLQQTAGSRIEAVARRFFHPLETAYLEKTGFSEFFSVWAAKESYVKFTGEGITDQFSAFSVVNSCGLLSNIGCAKLKIIPFAPDYRVCVCSEQSESLLVRDRRGEFSGNT